MACGTERKQEAGAGNLSIHSELSFADEGGDATKQQQKTCSLELNILKQEHGCERTQKQAISPLSKDQHSSTLFHCSILLRSHLVF